MQGPNQLPRTIVPEAPQAVESAPPPARLIGPCVGCGAATDRRISGTTLCLYCAMGLGLTPLGVFFQ